MLKKIFTFLLIILFITSCSISEEVSVSETGEIEFIQKIDMPQMAAVMNSANLEDKIEMNQISNSENTYLEFLQLMSKLENKESKNSSDKYELYQSELSKIDFMKFRLDLRDKFTVEIINRSKSVEEYNTRSALIENTFKEINLKDSLRIEADKIAKLSKKKKTKRKKNKNKGEETAMFSENPFSLSTGFDYSFDGKKFSKKIDVKRFLAENNLSGYDSEEDKQLALNMIKQIKYKYKYTFPKKIKSLSIQDAMFTSNGKSFVVEYSLYDVLNNPEVLNFEVVLED